MSLRYMIRRPNPGDLAEVKTRVPDLDSVLGKPEANYERTVSVTFGPLQAAHFRFMTQKVGNEHQWLCPSIEFDCDGKEGVFALCDSFQVPRPSHIR